MSNHFRIGKKKCISRLIHTNKTEIKKIQRKPKNVNRSLPSNELSSLYPSQNLRSTNLGHKYKSRCV